MATALPELSTLKWVHITEIAFPVAVMGLIYIRHHLFRRRLIGKVFFAVLAVLYQIVDLAYIYFDNFRQFQKSPVTRLLLPPHSQSFNHLVERLGVTVLVGWATAAILAFVLWFIFLRHKDAVMLDGSDAFFLVLATIFVGWPGVLMMLAGVFALSVVGLLVQIVMKKKSLSDRLIITPYILPAAILTIIFKTQLLDWTHLTKIRF